MELFHEKQCSFFGSSTLYLSWHDSNLLPVKYTFSQFFWTFIYYDASHGMPMEASNFPASKYTLKYGGSPGSLEKP